MWIWLLTSDEGDSQVCKNLFLRRRQEIADDESQGLDGQFLGGVELDGTRGSDDLRGISDRRFCSLGGLYGTSAGSSGSNGWERFFRGEGEAATFDPVPQTLSVIVLEAREHVWEFREGTVMVRPLYITTASPGFCVC